MRTPAAHPAGGRWWLIAAAGLAAHALLLTDLLTGWPVVARVLVSGVVLVFMPGLAFVRLGLLPPGGAAFAPAWALGFGVAWNTVLVLASHATGQTVIGLERVAWVASLLLWAIALRTRPPAEVPTERRPGRVVMALVALTACLAALHVARLGPIVTYQSDGPDHVGTVRRIAISGDAFPEDAYFKGAGPNGVDPRKGVWHPQVAMIARLSDADPYDVWRWLPALLAPVFILNIATIGLLAGGPPGAAVAALGLLLTYGGTIAQSPLRQAGYSSRLAEQLVLATMAAVLADLIRPSARRRVSAVLLGFAAVSTHLFAIVHLAVPLGALGIALIARDRGFGGAFRRLFVTSMAVGIGSLPFLAWRAQQAYAPANVIHTETQGMLYLVGHWSVISLGFLWTTFSWCWVLLPLLWVLLWKWGRRDPVALWILSATLAAMLMTYNPLVVGPLESRVGYLLQRALWFVPVAVWLAWLLPRLGAGLVASARRGRATLVLAAVTVTLVPALEEAAGMVLRPAEIVRGEYPYHVQRWRDALDWMREHLPSDEVVLADPVTSYLIPMMTARYVVTLVDQHSSPNDPHALERLLDARDALDPHANWDRVREVVDQYGVGAIALNGRFEREPRLDYWGPTAGWFRDMRARLDAHPRVFERVFDVDDLAIYLVHRPLLDSLSAPPPSRSYVVPWSGGRAAPESPPPDEATELPDLLGVDLPTTRLARGDTLLAVARWHAARPLLPGSYGVAVRLDRPLPDGIRLPAFVGKPWRKLLERFRGERYRITAHHLPAGGVYGVDLWSPQEVVLDSFQVVVPRNAAPGDYTMRVRMLRQPHFPNFRLSDYFFDDDLFSGRPSGSVRILEGGATDGSAAR